MCPFKFGNHLAEKERAVMFLISRVSLCLSALYCSVVSAFCHGLIFDCIIVWIHIFEIWYQHGQLLLKRLKALTALPVKGSLKYMEMFTVKPF